MPDGRNRALAEVTTAHTHTMASVNMNDEELGKVLAALPGTSSEEVERLCSRVIAAGGSTNDKGLVASDDGFEAFLALFGGMAAQSTFCARLFEGTQPHQIKLPRAALVARVRWVIQTLTHCRLQWWSGLIVEFAGSTDPARLAEAAALLQKSDACKPPRRPALLLYPTPPQ